MIQSLLDELQTTWGFGPEELADIKKKMTNYTMAALMDSNIREECCALAAEQE
jgi:hypothetical protein